MLNKTLESVFKSIEMISDNKDMKSIALNLKFSESLEKLSVYLESSQADDIKRDENLIRARIYAMELEALFADIVEEIETKLT